MATIDGPKVQMPNVISDLFDIRRDERGAVIDLSLKQEWAQLFAQLQRISFYSTRSGPTASRPTSTSYRWIGMSYFDTSISTHGLEINLAIASTNVWVNGIGQVV